MKIAILGTRGIPNNYGGYEQLAEYLSVGLVEKGHEVTVYNNHLHPFKEKTYKGVHVRRIFSPEKIIGSSANIIYDYLSLVDAVSKRHDVILECGYQSSSLGLYLYPLRKARIVTNMDGLDWMRSKWSPWVQKLTKWFEKLGAKKSHVLIADNLGMKEYLWNEYKVDSVFIPYGATIPDTYSVDFLNGYNLSPDDYYILVARLEPENNIEMILDGFVSAKSERKFIVVGNYKTRYGDFLKNKYSGYPQIQFIGGVYELEKLNALRHFAKIYFHGHSVGGTNPSLLDAMACGCYIIAHDNPFNRNVLQTDGNYFKSTGDVSELLSHDVGADEKEKFILNNLHKISTVYTWQNIVDEYEAAFFKAFSEK